MIVSESETLPRDIARDVRLPCPQRDNVVAMLLYLPQRKGCVAVIVPASRISFFASEDVAGLTLGSMDVRDDGANG